MQRLANPKERYEAEAREGLRRALWARGLTYREMAQLLTLQGIPMTRDTLANKIGRGRFSASFYLLCLALLERPTSSPNIETLSNV